MSNEMPAEAWNAQHYQHHASFVPQLGMPLLELVRTAPPARVLDLGCGDGALTAQLVARGYQVLGVDYSASMVAAAQARGLAARQLDGHALPFHDEFELVFSNATLHWLTRPDEVLAGVYRALCVGGSFVGELGGVGNTQSVVQALVAQLDARGIAGASRIPWYFPSPGDYATRLERAGFRVQLLTLFERPTPLPGALRDWIETFGQSFTSALPAHEREGYLRDVEAQLSTALRDEHGGWVLDYVRLRFSAQKPS